MISISNAFIQDVERRLANWLARHHGARTGFPASKTLKNKEYETAVIRKEVAQGWLDEPSGFLGILIRGIKDEVLSEQDGPQLLLRSWPDVSFAVEVRRDSAGGWSISPDASLICRVRLRYTFTSEEDV